MMGFKTNTNRKVSSVTTKQKICVKSAPEGTSQTKSVVETTINTDEEEFSEWEGLNETPGYNSIIRRHYRQYEDIAKADSESTRTEVMKKYIDLTKSEKVLEACMNRASLSAQWAGMEPSKNQLKLQKRPQKRVSRVKNLLNRRKR